MIKHKKNPGKTFKITIWICSLLTVIIVSVLAAIALDNIKANEAKSDDIMLHQISYKTDGRPDGEDLALMPNRITDKYIYFEDRIVKRYSYNTDVIEDTVTLLNGIVDTIPENINSYLMLIPSRIAFEYIDGVADNSEVAKTFDDIYFNIHSDIEQVKVLETLSNKTGEYIYFRTDETWTALGAYFAAEEFLKKQGKILIPIKEYEEEKYINYVGTLRVVEGAQYLADYADYVSYYTLNGSNNSQTITALINITEYIEYETPVIALSRMGTDIFIGRVFSHSIIKGDENDGSCLMIIGDKNAKIFAPWMIPYYETIYLVNPSFFNGSYNEFNKMLDKGNVTDLLIMESVDMLGLSISNIKMSELFGIQVLVSEEE